MKPFVRVTGYLLWIENESALCVYMTVPIFRIPRKFYRWGMEKTESPWYDGTAKGVHRS